MTPKPTVLVVTPDPNMRNLLQEVLQADSWEVEAADGIADAWEQVIGARSAFNLVVIDLLLPEVDIEVTVHQMRQKVGEGLDILFVSPCGGDGLAHRAQRLGGRHLLGPLNLDDLRFQAKAALRTSANRSDSARRNPAIARVDCWTSVRCRHLTMGEPKTATGTNLLALGNSAAERLAIPVSDANHITGPVLVAAGAEPK